MKKKLWHMSLAMALAFAAIPAGCIGLKKQRFVSRMENTPALDFELKALDGGKVRLSEYRGRPVVVAFFAYG